MVGLVCDRFTRECKEGWASLAYRFSPYVNWRWRSPRLKWSKDALRFRRESHMFAVLRNGRLMRITEDVAADSMAFEPKRDAEGVTWKGFVGLDNLFHIPHCVMRVLDDRRFARCPHFPGWPAPCQRASFLPQMYKRCPPPLAASRLSVVPQLMRIFLNGLS